MSVKFRISDDYKIVCTAEFPGEPKQKNGQWVNTRQEVRFVAVFQDMGPDELESLTEKIKAQIQPLFDLLAKMKSQKFDGGDVEEARSAVEAVSEVKPLIDRKLIRIEDLEIEKSEGGLLDADATREFVLKHPRFRAAIEKGFEQLHESQGGAGLGNLLKSAVAGHA